MKIKQLVVENFECPDITLPVEVCQYDPEGNHEYAKILPEHFDPLELSMMLWSGHGVLTNQSRAELVIAGYFFCYPGDERVEH
jgi:hypothetical protein